MNERGRRRSAGSSYAVGSSSKANPSGSGASGVASFQPLLPANQRPRVIAQGRHVPAGDLLLRPVVHDHAFEPGVVAVLEVLDELAVGPGVQHARAGQQHGAVQAQADRPAATPPRPSRFSSPARTESGFHDSSTTQSVCGTRP